MRSWIIRVGLCLFLGAAAASSRGDTDQADALYGKYRNALYQVRVIEIVSGKKTSIGSGFCVSTNRKLATNYHVVQQVIRYPDLYRLECEGSDGITIPLHVLDIDVIHDLAVVQSEEPLENPLALSSSPPRKGTTLYALGNPHDLGMVIVDGTYNGLVEKSFHDKILFSGSLNPGMSGGPAIDSSGQVVGINVSTAGSEISFLVPVRFLQHLLDRSDSPDNETSVDLHKRIEEQLLDNQQKYLTRLLEADWKLDPLGEARVPVIEEDTLRIWGGTQKNDEKALYERTYMMSSSAENIHISDSLSTGDIGYNFRWIVSRELNPFRFYSLLEHGFQNVKTANNADEDDVTAFENHVDFVRINGRDWRVVLSVRTYRKYPALHDFILSMCSVSEPDRALLSNLWLTGVSREMGLAFIRNFMGAVQWPE